MTYSPDLIKPSLGCLLHVSFKLNLCNELCHDLIAILQPSSEPTDQDEITVVLLARIDLQHLMLAGDDGVPGRLATLLDSFVNGSLVGRPLPMMSEFLTFAPLGFSMQTIYNSIR